MNINNVYIEKRVENHSNTHKILERIKFQNIIICNSYSEVFNPSNQNFRIQKKFPSLILAKKENSFIKKTPLDFTIGYKKNYYFSHMLNCPFDCKYCYLQGMFNSANYLIFVNYEDFYNPIQTLIEKNKEKLCFFSGYDCDSLALENITGFLENLVNNFHIFDGGVLELRSKSTNVKFLSGIEPIHNLIPAFSLNPQFIIKEFESGTPNLVKRLSVIKSLQEKGWNIGVRFDPIIWLGNKSRYESFFKEVFKDLNIKKIHSITLGSFRMPTKYLKKLSKIRPEDSFIQTAYIQQSLSNSSKELSNEVKSFCKKQILKFIEKEKLFEN